MFRNKYLCIAKDDYPVEGILGRPVLTFFRRLFLTRKIERTEKWEDRHHVKVQFEKK